MATTPKPKKVTKPKTMPKATVTKSRGSNTAKQVGDMNQREDYNPVRGKSAKKMSGGLAYTSKETKASAKASKGGMVEYKRQRAGGKGK